jgi:hypothetical protein
MKALETITPAQKDILSPEKGPILLPRVMLIQLALRWKEGFKIIYLQWKQ